MEELEAVKTAIWDRIEYEEERHWPASPLWYFSAVTSEVLRRVLMLIER